MTRRYLPILIGFILAAKAVMIALLLGVDPVEQARLAARYTARVGFPIFMLTYCASSLLRLWPSDWTKALVRHRRQWGLSFALTHSVHLVALTSYIVLSGDPPQLVTVLGGGSAYLLMYAMALTSNDASMKVLGRWWKRLHVAGIHTLWFVFTFSYFGRLFDPGRMEQGLILFPIALAGLGLRIAAWRKSKRGRQTTATA
jgi:methionine sulfoxide reductase heme-binding subunit